MKGYPLGPLHEEMAYLAYYLHWDRQTLLDLEHRERRLWCDKVGQIHQQQGDASGRKERSIEEL